MHTSDWNGEFRQTYDFSGWKCSNAVTVLGRARLNEIGFALQAKQLEEDVTNGFPTERPSTFYVFYD